MSVELFLARRYLFDRRHGAWGWLISLMATGSVALGVATLIVTLAIMTGFREDIRQKMLGVHPHIFISSFSNLLGEKDARLAHTLNKNEKIVDWSPFVTGQILMGRGKNSSGATIKGIDPEKEPHIANLEGRLKEGSWNRLMERKGEKPGIILGQELARIIGARMGDKIWVVTPSSIELTGLSVPRAHLFKVEGLLNTGLYDYDSILAYANLKSTQKLFQMEGKISGVGVRLKQAQDAEKMARELQVEFEGRYWIRSWIAQNKNLFSALKLERTVMFTLLTLLTVVAAFMIGSNLLLSITQKIKEIGILRAMGATANTIKKIFLYQGLIMGLVGNAIGVLGGLGISYFLAKTKLIRLPGDVYYIDHLPIRIVPFDILLVVTVAALIVLMAAIYPAGKAAKLDPLDAIRYG